MTTERSYMDDFITQFPLFMNFVDITFYACMSFSIVISLNINNLVRLTMHTIRKNFFVITA